MINIAVCDDEEYMLEELAGRITAFFAAQRTEIRLCKLRSAAPLLDCCREMDAVFLDIRLEGMDGMEAARRMRKNGFQGQLIFVSVLQELVFDAFEVQSNGFLVKPLDDRRFEQTMRRMAAALREREPAGILVQKGNTRRIIPFDDIVYCEVINRKIYLHLAGGETVDYYEKLGSLEKKLDGRFFKCHRSYLLNLKYLTGYRNGQAQLSTGCAVPVSRLRGEAFTEVMLQYMRELER